MMTERTEVVPAEQLITIVPKTPYADVVNLGCTFACAWMF
jgi:hypothetical protein